MRNKLIITIFGILLSIHLYGAVKSEYSLEDVPNMKLESRQNFVSDPNGYLTATERQGINARLLALQDSTSAEMAVVLLPGIGDADVFEFAQDLATKWGIGKKDKENGVLLLFVMDQHEVRLHTGYGVEGILTDAVSKRIIEDDIIPFMREDNVYGAVNAATLRVCRLLTDPAAVEEIKSEMENDSTDALDDEVFKQFLVIVAGIMFLATAIVYLRALWKAKKIKGNNFAKATLWHKKLITFTFLTGVSLGTGIVFLLLAIWHYRHRRTKRIRCDKCNSKMKRLDEAEDNKYLTSGEDCEERLHSVDYDVWQCPSCGEIKKFSFPAAQNVYHACPVCHAITYQQVSDKVIVRATEFRDGVGEYGYLCHHCGHRGSKRHIIEKGSGVGAALAGAALGSALGSGRSSGGGGSWGGGGFGGGGASGKW